MRRPAGVCVVGSIHMDVIATAARLPTRGESIVGSQVALSPGGKAGNQAAQAARYDAPTFLIARVGQDDFGDRLRAALTASGVDTTHLTVDAQAGTGISPVLTGADGEYASIIVPGASWRLEPADIDAASDAFAQSAVLLVQCEIPVSISVYAAQRAHSLGMTVICNASPAPADAATIPEDLWPAVDVLLVNGAEAERLGGQAVADVPGALQAAAHLQQRLGTPAVVITLGGHGAVALDAQGVHHAPTWRVPVDETIGAGDAFAGVLASELARGRPLAQALPLANAAGALAVTRPGAHDSLPSGAEIHAFLRDRSPAAPEAAQPPR